MTHWKAPEPTTPLEPRRARPTFSVIVAAYQSAHVIADAVSSALEQDPAPLEVVVCDDGSTDDLRRALAPFGEAVRGLRIEHGGEAAAKNAAARAAHGDFLAVLDADDVFLPGRLRALGDLAMARPDLDILTTDAFLDVDGETVGRAYNEQHTFAVDDQAEEILARNFVFGLVAVRRERFLDAGGYDPAIAYTTDWDCWVRLVLDGARIGLVDEPLARYRLHENSMSARRRDMAEGRCMTLRKALARADLTTAQRQRATGALAEEQRRLDREELKHALETAAAPGDVRRRARRVAGTALQHRATRLKALAAAIAPRLLGHLVRRANERTWTTVGDTRRARRRPEDAH